VTAAFTALCLFGWYYSSQTMAQAAEKSPIEGELFEDEKMQDQDFRIHSAVAHETPTDNTGKLSPPDSRSRPLPDRPPNDQNTKLNPKPIDTATASPTGRSSNISFTQSASDSLKAARARAHWDATDVWDTQSYGQSKKACAMCAQHVEQ
jgi:hypothetical protein